MPIGLQYMRNVVALMLIEVAMNQAVIRDRQEEDETLMEQGIDA